MHAKRIHYPLLITTVLMTILMLWAGFIRIRLDTDVVSSLPDDHGVLSDAVYIFKHHPIQDRIAIDIALDRPNRDLLVQLADDVEKQLKHSGLFATVGTDDVQQVIPRLVTHIVDHLPFLFTARELETQVAPLIERASIDTRLRQHRRELLDFSSIGQAGLIARDPLNLKDLKMAALSALIPSQNARIYKGKLISADGRHLMILAQPTGSGTDTSFARKMTALIQRVGTSLNARHAAGSGRIVLTPVGAYRASLDNETMVRRDMNKAIFLATLGIAVLLLLAFPRPLIGLLALLPALVGTIAAFFVFSLMYRSISIMALGFGGAIISITVDHGIAYLLFLDRPVETFGHDASREVWSLGLLATLTTVGAFLVLSFSGFLIFKQLGIFSAMGIAFSFLFVHLVFPRIFPSLPAARSTRNLPLQRWADALASQGLKGGLVALLLAAGLVFWAKPQFNVDLSAMNSISPKTRSAESLFASVWGNVFSKIYVMTEAGSPEGLRAKGDRVLETVEQARDDRQIAAAFVAAELFPGPLLRQSNLTAWRTFWSPERVRSLRRIIVSAAARYGFSRQAFDPFLKIVASPPQLADMPMDKSYYSLLGITHSVRDHRWRQITSLTVGPGYEGEALHARLSALGKVFDARLFSQRMSRLLSTTFIKMLAIIGISVVVLLFLFFADWQLTLICLLPLVFAFVCTLGTLRLLGRNLDIPALMLAIVILGMGIDYSLFFIRAYQRYQNRSHPNFSLIRMSVLMAAVSTLIGFGALCSAQHTLLQSAGVTSFLGIGFSVLGAFLILPSVLDRRFNGRTKPISHRQPGDGDKGVQVRYRNMEPYPRFFAKFKLQLDPMFQELGEILPPAGTPIDTIIDIGTGYGVPACWLLQRYPDANIYGIEPEPDRVRVANLALGNNGTVIQGLAPQVPEAPNPADAAFMLDMCHFLDNSAFELTLERLHARLRQGGLFLTRVVLEPRRRMPWSWWLENSKMKIKGTPAYYRSLEVVSELIRQQGFEVQETKYSGKQDELAWVIAKR
jgi:predicted exporter